MTTEANIFLTKQFNVAKELNVCMVERSVAVTINLPEKNSCEARALKYLKEGIPIDYKPYKSRSELHAR